jgi:DNA-directed RNA polymerase subunit N (RpoN/RPB10)
MSEELPPIRCLSCGRVLAHRWKDYQRLLQEGNSQEEALNKLGLKNICCRLRMRNPGVILDSSISYQPNQSEDLEKSFNRLSISESNKASTKAALSALSNNESKKPLVEKEEATLDLPDLPALPQLDKIGEKKIVRLYRAW